MASGGRIAATGWIDHQFAVTFVIMGIVFLAAQGRWATSCGDIVRPPKSPPVTYSHGNTKLEIIWTALTTILFIGLNLMGSRVWASQRFDPAEAGQFGRGHGHAVRVVLPLSGSRMASTARPAKLMDPSSAARRRLG